MDKVIGRNDPCPCGSGLKYKNCCIKKKFVPGVKGRNPARVALVIGIGVIAAGATVLNIVRKPSATPPAPVMNSGAIPRLPTFDGDSTVIPAAARQSQFTPGPQPPGPVPEGKVWSAEHGHWHDIPAAPGTVVSAAPAIPADPRTPGPQPPGPVPEGKVWNEEHGHWHNILPAVATPPVTAPAAVPESSPEISTPAESPEVFEKPADAKEVVEPQKEPVPDETEPPKLWTPPSSVDVEH